MSDKVPIEVSSLLPGAERQRLARGLRRVTGPARRRLVWHEWRPDLVASEGAPPVVLLHGGSGSWTHWVRNILPLLDAGRSVLAADLPGFGESAPPANGNGSEAMLEPLAEGLGELLGAQSVDLVGFSFGGLIAGQLLAVRPRLARRLVLVGAPAMGVVPIRQFTLRAWRHLETEDEQAAVHRHNLGVLMLHDTRLAEGLALQVHVANVRRDRLPRRRPAHADQLARALRKAPCPVHAIYGAHDAIYGPYIDGLEAAFATATPDFRGIELIAGAGHWVQFEAAGPFNAALLRALGA